MQSSLWGDLSSPVRRNVIKRKGFLSGLLARQLKIQVTGNQFPSQFPEVAEGAGTVASGPQSPQRTGEAGAGQGEGDGLRDHPRLPPALVQPRSPELPTVVPRREPRRQSAPQSPDGGAHISLWYAGFSLKLHGVSAFDATRIGLNALMMGPQEQGLCLFRGCRLPGLAALSAPGWEGDSGTSHSLTLGEDEAACSTGAGGGTASAAWSPSSLASPLGPSPHLPHWKKKKKKEKKEREELPGEAEDPPRVYGKNNARTPFS